jgi:hypothetical protein
MDEKDRTVDCCPAHLPEEIMKNMGGPLAKGILRSAFRAEAPEELEKENIGRVNALHNAVAYYSAFIAKHRDKGKDGKLPSGCISSR